MGAAIGAFFTICAKVALGAGITIRPGKAGSTGATAVAGHGIPALAMLSAILTRGTVFAKAAGETFGAVGATKAFGAITAGGAAKAFVT